MDLPRAAWRKSSRSGGQGNCVEVADNLVGTDGVVLIRDSKNRAGPSLRFARADWTAFVTDAKSGTFDPA